MPSTIGTVRSCWPLAAGFLLLGCGAGGGQAAESDEQDQPAEVAGQMLAPLSGDLVAPGDPPGDLLEAPGDPGSSGAPKVFYLLYSDGRTSAKTNPDPCRGAAPKFVCDFAPTLTECQRQIQVYLDRWYADFNVIFTLTRPTSGSFYTEVISSGGGAWCSAATNVAGVAPFLCDDLVGGVAYTFSGGKSAKETAIIIAQEQAHLVGLEHTLSTRDIMDPTICPNCDGFEKIDNKIQNDHCGRATQNSYQMMQDRLGIWTGGIKPTLFGCQSDSVVPLVQILAPANKAIVADTFQLRVQASDDCRVSKVTVAVAPMGLKAESTKAPFEWTLTKITGKQTITVTAFDPSGKQSTASVTVDASAGANPGGAGGNGGASGGVPAMVAGDGAAGCQVGGCDVGGRGTGDRKVLPASVAVSLAMMAIILMATRRRPPIRARVSGGRRKP